MRLWPFHSTSWQEGFQAGFQQACQKLPMLHEELQQAIRTQAIEETLARLEPVIVQRLTEVAQARPQPLNALLQKRDQFLSKGLSATDPLEKAKYQHYLEALDWMLHASNGVYSHQPLPQ